MRRRTFLWSLPIAAGASAEPMKDPLFRFGVIADCQFADQPDSEPLDRRYRLSPHKLREAVADLNSRSLEFVVNLGDTIDCDLISFETMMPIFGELKAPVRHVLGNHDFSVAAGSKKKVADRLGLSKGHYSWERSGWRFLVLDGNAVSLFAHEPGSPAMAEARKIFDAAAGALLDYNGGLGESQLAWLDAQLKAARTAGQKVIVFCHYPVFPENKHNLWDSEAVLKHIDAQSDVMVAWMNGHNHAGNYGTHDGIHFVNFKGMVDTPENCWAEVAVWPERIEVTGFGREPRRSLRLRSNRE
jgi:3',5'-cyclic AMP phosphodiesterase CpdA